jgi:hypothetical protein
MRTPSYLYAHVLESATAVVIREHHANDPNHSCLDMDAIDSVIFECLQNNPHCSEEDVLAALSERELFGNGPEVDELYLRVVKPRFLLYIEHLKTQYLANHTGADCERPKTTNKVVYWKRSWFVFE